MQSAEVPRPKNQDSKTITENIKRYNLKYMHDSPRISPNYGNKRKRLLPKTNISKVLLYDNATQEKMLDENLSHLNVEQNKSIRMFLLNRHSFLKRRQTRMKKLQEKSTEASRLIQSCQTEVSMRGKPNERKYSVSSGRSSCESSLSFLDSLRLPQVDPNGDRRHVVYKCRGTDGRVNIYYSVDNGIFSDVIPSHAFYPKTSDDPRFQELEESLERMSIEYGGYNELSPSFKHNLPTLPDHITEIKQMKR